MKRYEHILAATDFSELGDTAVAKATALAIAARAELTLLHVIPPIEYPPSSYAHYEVKEHLAGASQTRKEAGAALKERIAPELTAAGLEAKTELREGDPADEIVKMARDRGVDLVVLATHGRRGIRRIILGSVTERVVRESPGMSADVLVVS